MWVDTSTPNLRITGCTASFTTTSGPLMEGQGLLEFIPAHHTDDVMRWLRAATDNPHTVHRAHEVTLQFRRTGGMDVFKATCFVEPSTSNGTSNGTICLVFSAPRLRRRRRRRRVENMRGVVRRAVRRLRL